jgi:hypothetical protein
VTAKQEIQAFLRTGEHSDPLFASWPGRNVLEKAENGDRALRDALVAEVRRRCAGRTPPEPRIDPAAHVRERLRPMVEGLLPLKAWGAALELLVRSVVFVLPSTVERVLREQSWLNTAWDVANLYLRSVGARALGREAPHVLGLSSGGRAYVSLRYFRGSGRFDDWVVHECAHALHDTKRRAVGLTETRTRERLVDLDFRKRETFAYSCEAFSRIAALGKGRAARLELVDELARRSMPADVTVDKEEYLSVLRDAAGVRNGWKRILERCRRA